MTKLKTIQMINNHLKDFFPEGYDWKCWYDIQNPALEGKTPREVLKKEGKAGAERIYSLLDRIGS